MLTGKQKSYLKGLSHNMQPIIQIGKNGVNEMLVKTIEDALEARELIKISVLQNCLEEPKTMAIDIADVLEAGSRSSDWTHDYFIQTISQEKTNRIT